MKNIISCLFAVIFLLNISYCVAQPSFSTVANLEDKNQSYFDLNRESAFLHLNKTILLPGEALWFSAYVYSTKFKTPSLATTNLEVNIYTDDGILLQSKVVLIKDGNGSGYFEFDRESVGPGTYMVTAKTTYMKNFDENLGYQQIIKILGQNETEQTGKLAYDLQLLPEGGHLLASVENIIGVKFIDCQGKGVPFKNAKLTNGLGITLAKFNSNIFGHAKFKLLPRSGEDYTLTISTKNGEKIIRSLQKPDPTGIALMLEKNTGGDLLIKIKTNQISLLLLTSKPYMVSVHQNGIMKSIPFEFGLKRELTLVLKKEDFFDGVNTVTVFNENLQPISERLFYNFVDGNRIPLSARFVKSTGDSLKIGVKSQIPLKENSISISVLPAGTESYQSWNNTFSAFTLKPYINGNIEKGYYYFSENIKKQFRENALDLLLLTQGWSAYDWNEIYKGSPKLFYVPDVGFEVSGRVSRRNEEKEKKLIITAADSFTEVVDIAEDGSFKIDGTIVYSDTALIFRIFNEKSKRYSMPSIYANVLPSRNPLEEIEFPKSFDVWRNEKAEKKNLPNIPFNFIAEATKLDTVVITKNKLEEERKKRDGFAYAKTIYVDRDVSDAFTFVPTFIRFKGFTVAGSYTKMQIYGLRNIGLGGAYPTLLFFNELRLTSPENIASAIANLRMDEVESIYINKSGARYGLEGSGGVIKIKTKTRFGIDNSKEDFLTYAIQSGFAKNKKFYAPRYKDYSNSIFNDYGTIYWVPQLELEHGKESLFKVLNTLSPELDLYIEGITKDGKLISENIKLKTENLKMK